MQVTDWTVLIIDDSPDTLSFAALTLDYHGADVMVADSAVKGLYLLDELTPTLMLVDIHMPDIDGWGVLEAVQHHPTLSATPVIAVSAFATDEDRQRMLDRGFAGYIAKPFNALNLIDNIERILQGSIFDC